MAKRRRESIQRSRDKGLMNTAAEQFARFAVEALNVRKISKKPAK